MKTLLIVDDEPKICVMLARFFESRGFRTATAQSGRDALDKLSVEPLDYLLLDIRMPDMSGLEVLTIVKQRYPNLKIVMVTALDDAKMARRAFQLGASDYITKPIGFTDPALARAFFSADD